MTSIVSASQLVSGQVQTLDSVRAHALPSDAMILASSSLVTPTNQNTGSYAIVESANASITLTTTGSVPAVTQSPFADVYKEGSLYFNGTTGNYITTTAAGLINSPWGTVGMTIEAWVNYPTFTGASLTSGGGGTIQVPTLFGFQQPTNPTSSISFGSNVNGYVTFFYNCTTTLQTVTSQTQLAANTWNHIAMTCSTSGQIFLFVNGVQSQIVANRNGTLQTATYYETVQSGGGIASGNHPVFGQFNSVACNAYMADFRIIAGAPVYTGSTSSYATFTVPPAPLTIAATGTTHMLVRAGQNSPTIQNGALTFDRGLKQFMNFGPQTFNIVTRGFTAVWRGSFTGTAKASDRLFEFGTDFTNGYMICYRPTAGGPMSFGVTPSTGTASQTVNSSAAIVQGTTYVYMFRYDPVSQILDIWANGVQVGSTAVTTATLVADRILSPVVIGGYNTQGTTSLASNTFAVYNRALSNVEIYNSYLALNTVPQQKTLEIGDVNGTPALSVAGDGKVFMDSVGLTSNVLPWPPAAMTGYDTVINGGVYKARASSELGASNLTWYSFNKDGFSTYWTSQNSVYSTSLPYGYTGTYSTTDVNGSVYPGEWVQVQLASSIVLSSYSVTSGGFPSTRSPGKFVLLGSRDGIIWFLVDSRSGATYTSPYVNTYTIAAGQGFSYYRIVTSQTCGSAGVAELGELILYGTADTSPALTIAPATTFNTSVATPSLTGIAGDRFVPQDFSSTQLNVPAYVVSNTATVANTVAYSSFGPFAGEGSLYFPGGTGQYVNFGQPTQLAYNWTSYDFTLEAWVYPVNYSVSNQNIFARDYEQVLYYGTDGVIKFYMAGVTTPASGVFTGGTVTRNQWNHLTVSWSQSAQTIYMGLNGAITSIALASGTPTYTGTRNFVMGQWSGVLGNLNAYITNLRVTRGLALYTTTFTPPTGPLQPIQGVTQAGRPYGTVLLLRNAPAPGRIQTTKFSGSNSGTVLSFPPAAMTGYATALASGYGQGTYVASSSGFNGTEYPWNAFDKNSANTQWETSPAYAGSPPYGVTTGVTTTDVNGTAYTGEWIQIQMPSSMVISNYQMRGSYYADIQSPGKWWILGSRDGASWFLVDSRTGITAGTSRGTYIISSSQAFTYYRFVVNQLQGAGVYGHMTEWTLDGTIESVNITPDGRVGLGVVNPTRALEVAGDIVCSGTISGGNPVMFRNRLINGDMRVFQRVTTSFSGLSTVAYCFDRFSTYISGTGGGTRTINQVTDVPFGGPFFYSANVIYTAQTTGVVETFLRQGIELANCTDLIRTPITVSFWYKSNRTGTHGVRLFSNVSAISNMSNTRLDFNVNNANTWEYEVLTFGNSVNASLITSASLNQLGLNLDIGPMVAGQISITINNNDYFTLTGVQLEKGTVATPFEVRPYATELALCQRYYYRLQATSTYSALCQGSFIGSTTNAQCYIPFPVDMRIGADSTRFSNSAVGTFFFGSGPGASCTAITQIGNAESTRGNQIRFTTSVTQTTGVGCIVEANNTTTAFLAFDAEL